MVRPFDLRSILGSLLKHPVKMIYFTCSFAINLKSSNLVRNWVAILSIEEDYGSTYKLPKRTYWTIMQL